MQVEDLNYDEKCCLFVIGALEELKRLDVIDGDGKNYATSNKGLSLFDQLTADWFLPDLEDIIQVFSGIEIKVENEEDLPDLALAVHNYYELKERLNT